MTATNAAGTSEPSDLSNSITVGALAAEDTRWAGYKGLVGQSYHSRFAVSGTPASRVTLVSGQIPPGLTLGSDGS